MSNPFIYKGSNKLLVVQREKSKYFKMNRSANEFEFGILGFYYFRFLLFSTRVSDTGLPLIMATVVSASNLYSKDCFDRVVILFNSRI